MADRPYNCAGSNGLSYCMSEDSSTVQDMTDDGKYPFAEGLPVLAGTYDWLPVDGAPIGQAAFPSVDQIDMIDDRVIMQSRVWVNRLLEVFELDSMSVEYRRNVTNYLLGRADSWIVKAAQWIPIELALGVISVSQAERHLELLRTSPSCWLEHTPLLVRLRELNGDPEHSCNG